MPKAVDEFARATLGELAARGLHRRADDGSARRLASEAAARLGLPLVDASSNDYLGLASLGVSRETDVQGSPVGAGASRLIHGTRDAQLQLERELAEWVGQEAALLFTSGYAANLGLLGALGTQGSVIFSDQLNHASIIDGCRLSRAVVCVVPHLDVEALRRALEEHSSAPARWVVTESCFSMDGDGPNLRALRKVCDEHGAGLLVDEAHSLGVFGERGAGRLRQEQIQADATIGTLGKAVGSQGAFVAGSGTLRDLLWNQARSFVFSTATSPLLARATLFHVQRAQADEEARARLRANTEALHSALAAKGLSAPRGLAAPIIPVLLGDNDRALQATEHLSSRGILAQAIRPPTVPVGTARIRLTVSAAWPAGAAERVAAAVGDVMESGDG